MSDDADSPLDFPCAFPIKAMGRADADLAATVWAIVRRHAPATPASELNTTPSRHGRFVSVTVTITAESRAQLDAIYHELQAHRDILATL